MNNIREKGQMKMGLEIHITIDSLNKVFNLNRNFKDDNESVNDIESWELGYLGTLPVLNYEVINLAVKFCSFLNMKIDQEVKFDRKIYNYFDLPKGFQITQKLYPIGENGVFPVLFNEELINISISRVQIEEDTAKSSYEKSKVSLDFNRSGNPLIELVTDPVFDNVDLVLDFVKQIRCVLKYLSISQARMEKGQFRIDLNFSFKFGDNYQTPRYEIKNLNSLKNLKNSVEKEFEKHYNIFNENVNNPLFLKSETLGFNEREQKTFVQRDKVNYFYLPEINIPKIKISKKEINVIKKNLPNSPSFIWRKITESQKVRNGNLIFENFLILKILNILENKKINYYGDFDNLVIFILNNLVPSLLDFNEEEISSFFKNHLNHIWKIFTYWKDKKISKSEVNEFIKDIAYKNDNFYKFQKKINSKFNDKNLMEFEFLKSEINLIIKTTNISKKIISQHNKLLNLLVGVLKIKFPNHLINVQDISNIISDIFKD
ncbi:MAG: Glutamyl-tRNA(Gln) amidotransferase subunit B, chloroplastic/mitochondrial [Mycoplasmataceae bacterium]|nr:MAG: Glutamyl-tRNA(Gln) amidotransferase subunit B, chloroplastic/mitochondrial [Mycoplasmataceae bacterium]